MKLRLRRPRELALALRDLARRAPRQAEEYLETHHQEWESLVEADPHNAADILEAIDEEAAAELISDLEPSEAADLLEEMRDEAAAEILEELTPADAARLFTEMSPAEIVDIVEEMPADVQTEIIAGLEADLARWVTDLLAYPSDSAGGLMTTRVATLPVGLTAGEAIEALRRLHETFERMSYVFVVDDETILQGVVSFRELVFARPGFGLDEVMVRSPVAVRPETDREEVAELIQRYGLLALPVVSHRGQLLGIVTVDEAMEAVQEEATEDIAAMVGAGITETVYTPVVQSLQNRLPWILVNLALAFGVAWVISRFESTIETLAVLAAFMPVVASVGGSGGAQSLAVVIRALALEDIPANRARRVIGRELVVGLINGAVIAVLAGAIATVTTGDAEIGLVIGIAVFGNMVIGALAGASIPITLRALGQDPALASNIFLTLVTDLLGFGGFLAIAAALL